MNVRTANAIFFACGAAVGAACTYLGMRSYFDKKAEAEIDSYRAIAAKRITEAYEDAKRWMGGPEEQPKEEEAQEENVLKPHGSGKVVDYTSYFNEATSVEDSPEPEQDDEPDVEEELEDRDRRVSIDDAVAEDREPYPISYADFANSNLWYEKLSCTYYEGDDTLVDEDDEIIDDRDKVVSPYFREHFGSAGPDPDVVYIRNDQRATDYEICRTYVPYIAVGSKEEADEILAKLRAKEGSSEPVINFSSD